MGLPRRPGVVFLVTKLFREVGGSSDLKSYRIIPSFEIVDHFSFSKYITSIHMDIRGI